MHSQLLLIPLLICSAYGHTVHELNNGTYQLMTHGYANSTLDFFLEVETTGWVAVGVGPNPNMAGADIVVGWVDDIDNNNFTVQDMHAKGNGEPQMDETKVSDWLVMEAEKNETHTKMTFRRLLKTADPNQDQDFEIKNEDIYVIMAYGLNDTLDYHHSNRGSELVNLGKEGAGGAGVLNAISVLIALCAAMAFALH